MEDEEAHVKHLMEDEAFQKRLREKLEPELEDIRYNHLRFRVLTGTLDELEQPRKPKSSRLRAFLTWLVLFVLACIGIGALRLTLGW